MACFFYYLEWQNCVTKNKKEFKFIKFRRIPRSSKAPRQRCLRTSKNPTSEVGPCFVGR